jgi:uncharacterized protein YraI
MVRNKLLAMAALIMGFLLPAQAMAAYEAYTRVDLNLRVGPDITYGVIDVIPYGEPVLVIGCLDDYFWCDVEWLGLRGWVAAEYLVQPGTSVYLPRIAPQIGLPIVVFSFNTYHDRYYRDRPWYKHRHGRWEGHKWRRHRDRDRDRDRDREHADRDRPREGERTQRPRQRQEVERPRQRQEVERPRQRREVERPRERQQVERPRQRQETQRPRQRREVERPRQRQETQRVKQSQKSERPRQRSEKSAEKPRKGERKQRKLPPE